ncbi:MAG: S-layer homology domain-containing protein [Acidimicrobiia bacterium]
MDVKFFAEAALVAAFFVPGAAVAGPAPTVVELGSDEVAPDPAGVAGLALQATDPLGLVPGVDIVRLHSLGTDVIDVWTCGLGVSVNTVVAQLDAEVVPYFAAHSRGRLDVDFIAKGAASGVGEGECLDHAAANASPSANGALVAGPWSGGLAGPGQGESWPSNQRWALVGYPGSFSMVAAHELGHTQSWPHSFTTVSGSDYDNALDLMSGNYGSDGGNYGTWDLPFDTAVINRYAAGWIDAQQVHVVGAASASFTLETSSGNGTQMGVIRSGNKYFTLGARTQSAYDPIPTVWEGVEVYEVTPCPEAQVFNCFGDPRFDMGFREHIPLGRVPFDPFNFSAYSKALAHVISPGASKTVGGRTVSVTAAANGAYTVTVSAGASFVDTAGSVFAADIDWLAESGITKGCNPPTNNLFCPDDVVTRGQMAAFLHRAVPGLTVGAATDFSDDNGLIFESDIEWLSATGVTKGCNPPANDLFCPGAVVTRGQMAAFLHRALPGLAVGPATDFGDDDGLVFESDIEWLAATGVTTGCNPPANTQFCPGAPVTRGAMAAFLHRALGD